jgi:hypothetical protein
MRNIQKITWFGNLKTWCGMEEKRGALALTRTIINHLSGIVDWLILVDFQFVNRHLRILMMIPGSMPFS